MDLKQLQQFLVLAETLNFRAAAARLHMAQPPLSVSIRRLEEDVGARLFERSRSGVTLTAVGRSVLDHARRTLFHAEQFRAAVQLAMGGHAGNLRIDFVASSTIQLLPRAIAHFRGLYPRVDLHLSETNTDAIMVALRDGQTDVGIVRYPTPGHSTIKVELLERNHYVAALPLHHPKVSRPRLRLSELSKEPFIFPSRLEGSAAYTAALSACQRAGFSPNIVQQASHAQTIIALVESGLGVALVPDLWENLTPRAVVFKPLIGTRENEIGLAFACRNEESESVLIRNFRHALAMALSGKPN